MMNPNADSIGSVVNILLLTGLGIVAVSVVSYAVERLQAIEAPWQAQIAIVGMFLMFFGLAGAKMFSR